MATKELLTIEDIQANLGLAKGTIYNMVNRKENPMPYMKAGKLFFDWEEVKQWMRNNAQRRTPDQESLSDKMYTRN
jgi:predicted DNA-binding transcriptional regulator AlpA